MRTTPKLANAFHDVCAAEGLSDASVLRALVEAFLASRGRSVAPDDADDRARKAVFG